MNWWKSCRKQALVENWRKKVAKVFSPPDALLTRVGKEDFLKEIARELGLFEGLSEDTVLKTELFVIYVCLMYG